MPANTFDWAPWTARWERQQDAYIAFREQRFESMLSVLAATMPGEFTVLDVACGPGAVSERVAERFPGARVIAVDFDPVMLAMARARFANNARVTVAEADLKQEGWQASLGVDTIDAALSTTAIHWLPTDSVVTLYRTLATLIRPGGVFMNGDFLQFLETQGPLARMADDVRDRHFAHAESDGVEPWDHWWDDLATQPAVADRLTERNQRFSGPRPGATGYALHRAALLDAGFAAVDTVWQHFADRVMVAFR